MSELIGDYYLLVVAAIVAAEVAVALLLWRSGDPRPTGLRLIGGLVMAVVITVTIAGAVAMYYLAA
jgi:uncharacterized integral membrane protein